MNKRCDVCQLLIKNKNWRYLKDSNYVICDNCYENLEESIINLIEYINELEWERDNYYEAYQKVKTKNTRS